MKSIWNLNSGNESATTLNYGGESEMTIKQLPRKRGDKSATNRNYGGTTLAIVKYGTTINANDIYE